MRSEYDFLDGLRESPDDDDLRLVFSDWLEDQDDERAAFLRLQVQRRRLAPNDPSQADLVRQQHELIRRAQSGGWLTPLLAYGVSILRGNGLLAVTMTAGQLCDLDAESLKQPPWHWVDGLRLYNLGAAPLGETFATEALAHFRHLDLSVNALGLEGVGLLRAAPLDQLTTLDLERTSIPWDGGGLLAQAPWLAQLHGLNLAQTPLGNVGLRELIVAGHFDQLRVLELRDCDVGPLGAEALVAASRHLP